MTPKEKAKELINKYLLLPIDFPYNDTQDGQCIGSGYMLYNSAKQCALIAVDEIIRLDVFDCNDEWSDKDGDTREYWKQVKQEIEKL